MAQGSTSESEKLDRFGCKVGKLARLKTYETPCLATNCAIRQVFRLSSSMKMKQTRIRTTWDFDEFSYWPRHWTVNSLGLQNKSIKTYCSWDCHCEIFSSSVWTIGHADVVRRRSSLCLVIRARHYSPNSVKSKHGLTRAQRRTAGKRKYSWQLHNQNKCDLE